jgi:cytochrome P450
MCIGMKMAFMEIKLALVHFLRKFTVKKCWKSEVFLQKFNAIINVIKL